MSRWIKKIAWLSCIAACVAGTIISLPFVVEFVHSSSSTIASTPTPTTTVRYMVESLPTSEIHTVFIPVNQFAVTPAIAAETANLATFAAESDAIAVLNGGFFDPQNQLSTSYVVQQGRVVGDPTQNERLMNNPDLIPYLNKILNRTEFRRYQCGTSFQYDIALHLEPVPANCILVDALGAGPRLLPELALEQEGFTATANGVVIRDAIGSSQPNARTAIGIAEDGSLIWVMAAQKPDVASSGVSLPELAALLKDRGATEAMNLDGGSSSGLFYQGKAIYGKLDAAGNPVERAVKSVLLLKPLSP